jgi:very-short-patch-repair endonuclease
MTLAEKLLWERLRANQLDGLRWRRQQIIDGFIVDFYCHAASIVIELDGAVHDQRAEYDTARDEILATRGLLVLRITNTEVETDMNGVLARIRATCQERTARDLSPKREGGPEIKCSGSPSPVGEGAGG